MMGGLLIKEARLRAGLLEAALAERLGVPESRVRAWEARSESPTMEEVTRAVRACGLDLRVSLEPYDDHDIGLALQNLRLTPEERLARLHAMLAFVRRARRYRPVATRE
jgi:transcriptional regulator with XRE-family HTH domain